MIRIRKAGQVLIEYEHDIDFYKWVEMHLGSGTYHIEDELGNPVCVSDALFLRDKIFYIEGEPNDPISPFLLTLAISIGINLLAFLFTKKPKAGRQSTPQTGTLSPYQNSAKPNNKIPICLGYSYVVPDVAAPQFIDYIPSDTINAGETSSVGTATTKKVSIAVNTQYNSTLLEYVPLSPTGAYTNTWVKRTIVVKFYNLGIEDISFRRTWTLYSTGDSVTIPVYNASGIKNSTSNKYSIELANTFVLYTNKVALDNPPYNAVQLMPIDIFMHKYINSYINGVISSNPTYVHSLNNDYLWRVLEDAAILTPYDPLYMPYAINWAYNANTPTNVSSPTTGAWSYIGDTDGYEMIVATGTLLNGSQRDIIGQISYFTGLNFFGKGNMKRLTALFTTGYGHNSIIDIVNGSTRIDNYTRDGANVFFDGSNSDNVSYVSGWTLDGVNYSPSLQQINDIMPAGSFPTSHQVYDGGSLDRVNQNGVEVSDGWFIRTVGNTYGVGMLGISISGSLFRRTKKGDFEAAYVEYDVWVNGTLSQYISAADNPISNPAAWSAVPISSINLKNATDVPVGATFWINLDAYTFPFVQIAVRRKLPLDISADKLTTENLSIESIICINRAHTAYAGQSLRAVHLYEQAGKNIGGSEVRLLQKSDCFYLVNNPTEPLLNNYVPTGTIRAKWGFIQYNMASAILHFLLGYYIPKTPNDSEYSATIQTLSPFGVKSLRVGRTNNNWVLVAGCGIDWSEIDLQSFYDYQVFANTYKLSFDGMWSPDGTREDALRELAMYGMCDISVVDGKWKIRPLLRKNDVLTMGLPTSDIADISYSCIYYDHAPSNYTATYQNDTGLWSRRITKHHSMILNSSRETENIDLPHASSFDHATRVLTIKKMMDFFSQFRIKFRTSRIAAKWARGDHIGIPSYVSDWISVRSSYCIKNTSSSDPKFRIEVNSARIGDSANFTKCIFPNGESIVINSSSSDNFYPNVKGDGYITTNLVRPYYFYNVATQMMETDELSPFPDSCASDFTFVTSSSDVGAVFNARYRVEAVSSSDGISYEVEAIPSIEMSIGDINDPYNRIGYTGHDTSTYSFNISGMYSSISDILYIDTVFKGAQNVSYAPLSYLVGSTRNIIGNIPIGESVVAVSMKGIPTGANIQRQRYRFGIGYVYEPLFTLTRSSSIWVEDTN
jgi:hypothetical protein